MSKLITLIFFVCSLAFGDTEFAQPEPSIDNQRQIVFSITSSDDEAINHALSSANNVLKVYGPEKVHMRIIAYYHGIKVLLKKEKKFASRVDTLMQYDVEFVACANTLRTKNIKKEELIDGVEVVSSGVVEIVERVKEGWVNIIP